MLSNPGYGSWLGVLAWAGGDCWSQGGGDGVVEECLPRQAATLGPQRWGVGRAFRAGGGGNGCSASADSASDTAPQHRRREVDSDAVRAGCRTPAALLSLDACRTPSRDGRVSWALWSSGEGKAPQQADTPSCLPLLWGHPMWGWSTAG